MTGVQPDITPTRRYSVNEACELLGVHRNTLHRMTADGRIKCKYVKAGRKVRPVYMGREILKCWNMSLW